MNLRYGWAVVALSGGCAVGVPLDGDSTGATLVATGTTGDATTGPGTSSEPGTSTGEATTGEATTGSTSDGSSTGELPADGGELYPFDVVQSPISPAVADALTAIAADGVGKMDGVFMKVGGGTTASANFFNCLADPMAVMALPLPLQPAATYFNMTMIGDKTSFNRQSLAAMDGFSATDVLAGPLMMEADTIAPRFAVVLLGTKELELMQPDALFTFADDLLGVVDALIADGVVPILSTIPDRTMPASALVEVPRYNAVIRAVAQGRKVPLVDLHLALKDLAGAGLAMDGVDLNVALDGMMVAQPCLFDMVGAASGYNTRNLVTVEALDRARQIVVDKAMAPDPAGEVLVGAGALSKPFKIPSLPFVDLRSTADSVSDAIDMYAGTCVGPDEGGPEYIYELTIDAATTIRAMVFDRGEVDVDLHLLTQLDAKTCVKRDDRLLQGPLQPGTYYLAVDTVGTATPGEFALVVLPEG